MGAQAIPTVLINAKVYNSGNALLGQSDVEIGDLEYMSESVSGLGIAGELDLPVLGHTKSLSLKLKWNSVCPEAMQLLEPKEHQLAIYASIQNWQYDDGTFGPVPCRVSTRAIPKKSGIGKFEPGKKMEPESEFELVYIKMSINGKDVLEFDKMNFIGMVGGTDYLQQVRSQLGLLESYMKNIDKRQKVEIELDFPVQLADRKLEKVTMRRPIMRDMLKFNFTGDINLVESVALIGELCGLVPDEMELIDTCDFEKLQNQLLSFRGTA